MPGVPADRFDGWIAGVGSAGGLRAVVGHWPRSPLGAFSDVMVERADGRRILLAPTRTWPTRRRHVPLRRGAPGAGRRVGGRRVVARRGGSARAALRGGGRTPLGAVLRAVPRPLATRVAWLRAADLVARRALPGVRTVGTAGGGRRERYAALDLRRIVAAAVRWEGRDQGPLAPVAPPVRFGFGSTPPPRPSSAS